MEKSKEALKHYAKRFGTDAKIEQHEEDARRCTENWGEENIMKGLGDPVLDEMIDRMMGSFRDGYQGRAAIARYLKSKLEK